MLQDYHAYLFFLFAYIFLSILAFQGCASEQDLISQYDINDKEENEKNSDDPLAKTKVIAGIVFKDDFDYIDGNDENLPSLDYKIRMNSRKVFQLTQFLFLPFTPPPGPGDAFGKLVFY